jgi:hypothetical protein
MAYRLSFWSFPGTVSPLPTTAQGIVAKSGQSAGPCIDVASYFQSRFGRDAKEAARMPDRRSLVFNKPFKTA